MGVDKTMKRNQNHVFNSSLVKVILFVFSLFLSSGETCTKTQFTVVYSDKTTSCEDCGSCSPGLGLSHECGKNISSNAMLTCEECVQGKSFSSSYDTSSCTPCAVCSEDQVVLQNCTPTVNVTCAGQCYSKDRYYDSIYGGCLPCSKCCGDSGDVQEECIRKLGGASNMICTFNSSFNRCDTMSTAPPEETTTGTNTPAHVSTTFDAVTLSTLHQGSQGSSPLSKQKGLPNSRTPSIAVSLVGSLLLIGGCAAYVFYARKRHMSGDFRRKSDAEAGSHSSEHELKELGSAVHGAVRKVMKLEGQSGSSDPLLEKEDPAPLVCQCQLEEMDTKKGTELAQNPVKEPGMVQSSKASYHVDDEMGQARNQDKLAKWQRHGGIVQEYLVQSSKVSKPLRSLLEHESNLERICNVLDTSMPACGDYKAVAKHYGFDYYEVKSVLEKCEGGPSRALIEYLAATHPDLTVEEFAAVVQEETKRNDVSKVLRKYDSTEENEICKN